LILDQKEFDLIDPVKHALDAPNKLPTSNNNSSLSPMSRICKIKRIYYKKVKKCSF
jgi:hypothetical protein